MALYSGTSYWDADQLVPVKLRGQIQIGLSLLIGTLALLGITSLVRNKVWNRTGPEIKLFLILFGASTIWGILVGLMKGVPINYIIGDSRNLVIYLILFAVVGGIGDKRVNSLYHLFLICCWILLFKLLFSLIMPVLLGEGISWRSHFKQGSFFASMLFVAIGLSVYQQPTIRKNYSSILISSLAAFGIFASQARGLFFGVLSGVVFFSIISLKQKKFYRALPRLFLMCFVILIIGILAGIALQGDIAKSFGYWQGTSSYDFGVEFRIRQIDMLLTMFDKNWLFGAGLGAFDPTWEGYEDGLLRPYLVEMEYFNLLAKLGIIGISLWIGAFIFLFAGCIRTARQASIAEHRGLILGLTTGLVAMMAASFVQTFYSAALFHMYVVLVLLVLAAARTPRPIAQDHSSLVTFRR